MSQRDNGFRGGIQKGTTAFDADSSKLDKITKDARDLMSAKLPEYKMVKQFSKKQKLEYFGDDCLGFAPDGGAWFKDDKLIAVFESKKQNEGGNAYERWWDNAMTAKYLNPDVKYITFCTGRGSLPNGGLDKMARKGRMMMGENYEFHLAPDGMELEDILEIMDNALR